MSDDLTETAKATQEVAKTASKALDVANKFGSFISIYISGSLEQGIGLFEDKLKYMRWERQLRLMKRADDLRKEYGLMLPDKELPLKLVIPLLEGASLEEDDELQDLWAKLLINASNTNSGLELKRVFIDILERLTPLEAQILSAVYALPFDDIHHRGALTHELPHRAIQGTDDNKKEAIKPTEEVKIAIANLASIGCLYPARTMGGGEDFSWLNPTVLGYSFVQACTIKSNHPNREKL